MAYKVFLKHGVTRWAALSALSLKTILIAKEPLDGFEKKGETILKEPIATKKRENYIDWTTYFMATAFLARHRSKDPHYQVGACIVDGDKKIVGIGWNGRPTGVSDDAFTWGKGDDTLDNKHTYVCHAEANAIAFRTTVNVKDCILYVTLLPCNECAKMIIQSGIKKVYYFCEEKTSDKFKATKPMFDKAGVDYIEYKPKLGKVDLTFSSENLSNK